MSPDTKTLREEIDAARERFELLAGHCGRLEQSLRDLLSRTSDPRARSRLCQMWREIAQPLEGLEETTLGILEEILETLRRVPPDDIVNRERLESIGWIQLALACANKLRRRALLRHAGVQTRVRALSTQDQAALQPTASAMEAAFTTMQAKIEAIDVLLNS